MTAGSWIEVVRPRSNRTDKTCDATADATGTASCSRQIGTLTSVCKVVIT